ncbi:hypothetical protein G6F63_014295 [Rhizopus arrhizus]|nr:hypothetical protein G6F63_014295 [Rhizopus arrhizus]
MRWISGVVGTVADRLQAPIGLGIELADYRRQQAFLVAEVVIERTPGQPGLGGQVIHRGGGIAVLAEHTAGGVQQAGAGFFHLGAGAADHPELLTYAVHDYLHTEPAALEILMATPYRDLFAAPGTAGLALAGLLARLPLPMTGIGIITLLSQLRGSYALAGAV